MTMQTAQRPPGERDDPHSPGPGVRDRRMLHDLKTFMD